MLSGSPDINCYERGIFIGLQCLPCLVTRQHLLRPRMDVCLESHGRQGWPLLCMIFSTSTDHPTNGFISRRSHLPIGVKTRKWEDRMEKTKKARAIKMLQVELKEEKQAEVQRRRQITQERKRAAEEKKRIEEEKAKVRQSSVLHSSTSLILAQMGARKAARLRRKMGRTKKINH